MSNTDPSNGWTVNADPYLGEKGGPRLSVRLLWVGLALVAAGLILPYILNPAMASILGDGQDATPWMIMSQVMYTMLLVGISILASALMVRAVEHFLPSSGAVRPLPSLLRFPVIFWAGVGLAVVGIVIHVSGVFWPVTLDRVAPIEAIAMVIMGVLEQLALYSGVSLIGASFVLLALSRR